MSLELLPATLVYLDLFPAAVSVVTSEVSSILLTDECRAVVTDNMLYVIEDTADGPEMLIREPLRSFNGDNKTGYTVDTEFEFYHIKRAPNCGCGASLRGLHLFTDLPYVRPS